MNNFNDFLNKELNTPQKKAVTQLNGSMIVVAGAGSGKTRVITARITNLILNNNVDPDSILALTFTNKAAGEMKERITKFLGASHKTPFVGTFHSYALLLLKTNRNLLPFPDFSIIDDDDQKSILKKLIKKNGLEKQVSASQLGYQISRIKNQIDDHDSEIFKNPLLKELYMAYETEKTTSQCLDFDDLLITTLKIFQKNKSFKEKFQNRIKHILVDEYQDTNGVQHELLKQMALNKKKVAIDSICAVGDEDQSIYSWRGAKVTNMLAFQEDFKEPKKPVSTIKIEQNYRSVQPILKAANSLIKNNKQRHPKKLWSEKKAKNRILLTRCQSGYQEAYAIATCIKAASKKVKLNKIAVLYRTHFQSRSIEESLIKSSIPYVIIGGIRFYERKEIKDLLAYLKLIINPFDRVSLFRVINCPTRGLGAKFEELLYSEWASNTLLDFKQILQHLIDTPSFKIKGAKANSIKEFLKIFEKIDRKEKISTILEQVIELTGYFAYLKKAYDNQEAETKMENIQEFSRSMKAFEKKKKSSLEDFLHEIALLQEKIEENKDGGKNVQMMTLHAAKGLEFDTIVISGLEEGLLPSSKSLNSDEDLEEERRLFYVGITRAKERLILTSAMFRNTYGQISDQTMSRFVTEIPTSLMQSIDLTKVHQAKASGLFCDWMSVKKSSNITVFSKKPTIKKRKTPEKKKHSFKASKTVKSPWKKNQTIVHKIFGPGIIKKVESASKDKFYLTIFFKSGEKRILSDYVQKL